MGNVAIDVVSSDTSEALVSNSVTGGFSGFLTLTFTPADWATPQTVTVQGVDDSIIDGNQNVTVEVKVNGSLTSDTTGYLGVNPADVSVTNIDNDTLGVTVTPTTLGTTEAGGTADFTVRLNTPPIGNVVIDVASSDLTEGTVAPAQLTFDDTNWSVAQTVTVTGVDDAIADGNQTYNVTVDINLGSTTDVTGYTSINPADVSVTNTDNDTPGFTVTPTTGLTTNENGSTATYTVVLNTMPDGNVVIDLASSDTTEGTVSPASLTFTPSDWQTPQTVTITGVDDVLFDGSQTYTVTQVINAGLITDTTGYAAVDPPDVTVTNADNDTAGVTVNPTVLTTNEAAGAGNTATFTVAVNTQPASDVIIDVASSDTTEGTVSPAQLTFTSADWTTAQTVTVTGVDDAITDGNQTYAVTLVMNPSTVAPGYTPTELDPADVSVTNIDNDAAGVTVTPTSLTTNEAAGVGHTATFDVVLNTIPDSDVIIDIASTDLTEGTVSPAQLTFTPADSSTPQTVTVTGMDDLTSDGNQTYTVTVAMNGATSATGYASIDPADVSVTNVDDDIAGVTVTPTSLSTNEAAGAGNTATFTVAVNTQPASDVIIDVASSDTTEGTVSPAQLTFTSADWTTPQTVTVTGVDDLISDGNQTYTVALTMNSGTIAPGYVSIDPTDVSVTNIDNDAAGVTVTPTSLTTNEAAGVGHTATFDVVLNTVPDSNVIIDVASTDLTEGTVSPAQLTFTPADSSTPQAVTVTGVADGITDGNQTYTVTVAMNGATAATGYTAIDPADVSVTNNDNDAAGVTVNPTSGLTTTEAGGTAGFTVVLNTQPDSDVIIDIASSDTTEGTVSPAQITFNPGGGLNPQTVTVTGVNDFIVDGNQGYSAIVTMNGTTAATGYAGIDPADVSVTNSDDDAVGVTVSPTSGLVTSESGATATFTVVLNTVPDGDVVIDVASDTPTEGVAAPAQLTFTPGDWQTPQTVTVTGQPDGVVDADQVYTVVLDVNIGSTTDTTGYSGVNPDDVTVTNTNID